MAVFDKDVVDAVVKHMADDHDEDNLLIVRAYGAPQATKGVFFDMDEHGGFWRATEPTGERDLKIAWPSGTISERPEIRREVVLIHNEAKKRMAEVKEPFSKVLRESSWNDHDESEGADFMANIMRGKATLDDYAQLVAQHFFMYEALEDVVDQVAEDSAFKPFHDENLTRRQTLVEDLEQLFGSDWKSQISPVPATVAYAERIREVGTEGWIAGIIAHHYTRYLGDLSGGQMIARRVTGQHGFENGEKTKFYNFAELGSLDDFKNRYREALDKLGETLNDDDKKRMMDEVRAAYRFNTDVFIDMAKAKAAAASA